MRRGVGSKLKTAEYENKKNISLKNFKEFTFPSFTLVKRSATEQAIQKMKRITVT